MNSFLCLENASKIKVQNVRHLCELIVEGHLRRHARMPKDKFKLPSEIYNIVDLVYDGENRYVPNCFVCKHCSYLMFVPKSGGNSKLRNHSCVKKFMDEGSNHTDEIYLNRHFLTSAQREVLKNMFTALTGQKIKGMLPIDWKPQSWYEFLTKLQFNQAATGFKGAGPNARAEIRQNNLFAKDNSEVQDDSEHEDIEKEPVSLNNKALDDESDSDGDNKLDLLDDANAGPLDDKESENEYSDEDDSDTNMSGDSNAGLLDDQESENESRFVRRQSA